jgi:hypothetical protein
VNIYFPEKEVKEAYKELEKELMTPGGPGKEPASKPEEKPEGSSKFELISSAYAQEAGLADNIAQIVKRMPIQIIFDPASAPSYYSLVSQWIMKQTPLEKAGL